MEVPLYLFINSILVDLLMSGVSCGFQKHKETQVKYYDVMLKSVSPQRYEHIYQKLLCTEYSFSAA
jgi:hypothetical protein